MGLSTVDTGGVNECTVVITEVFQKVIGKLRMTIFYYGIFTVHFRTKVHPRVPFHSPDLRKGCRVVSFDRNIVLSFVRGGK